MNFDRPSDNIVLPFMRAKTSDPRRPTERRLPGFGWLPNRVRNHFVAMMGEFAGTFLFLFFAFSATQVANAAASSADTADDTLSQAPNTSNLLFISLAFGFSLAVNVWVFFRISGGLFNPAVTMGLCLIGAVRWMRGALVILSQLMGAIAAAGIVSCLFPGPLNVRTSLNGTTSVVRGLFIEMFLTAELVFTIFMLAAEKHKGTFLAPIGIGLALFIAELSGVYFTGGSLNPARSFGPAVILGKFEGYHWIYWLGPFLGSLIAVGFYKLVKILEYETANPGQDFNEKEAEVFHPDEDPATADEVRRPNVGIGHSEYIADETGIHRSPFHPRATAQGGARNGNVAGPGVSAYDGAMPARTYDPSRGVDGTVDPALTTYKSGDPARRSSRREQRSRGNSASQQDGAPITHARSGYTVNGSAPHHDFPHDQGYYQGTDLEAGTVRRSYDKEY